MAIVYDSENRSVEIDTDTCEFCKGNSAIRKKDGNLMTSREACEDAKTCMATVDWDRVFSKEDY